MISTEVRGVPTNRPGQDTTQSIEPKYYILANVMLFSQGRREDVVYPTTIYIHHNTVVGTHYKKK